MSVNRGRKRRKDSGLRRIFERSLKELKPKVHMDEEEQPTSSVRSDSTLQMESISDTLQESSGNKEDRNAAKPREGQENVPGMIKNKETSSAVKDEQKVNENLKMSEDIQGDSAISDNLNNSNSNLKIGENVLNCKEKGNLKSQVMEDDKSRIDHQSSKTSKNKDELESDRHSEMKLRQSQRKNQHILESKESIGNRKISEASRKEIKSKRSYPVSKEINECRKARESESKGPTSKHADKRRCRVEDKVLGRSKGKEKESACKLVEKREPSRSSDAERMHDKNQSSQRKGFGIPSTPITYGEDWMSELIDVPNLQPTERIIPNKEAVKENAMHEKCSTTLGLIHQYSKQEECQPILRSGDEEQDHTTCMSVSMNYTNNICDRHEENIFDSKSQTNADNTRNDMEKGVKLSETEFEELWECEVVPSATENIMKEHKFWAEKLSKSESVLETIKEESDSSSKETSIKHTMGKTLDVQDIEKTVSDGEAVEEDKRRNSDNEVVIGRREQLKVCSQDCSEDWMAADGDPHPKNCLMKDDDMETADIFSKFEETLSFGGENNNLGSSEGASSFEGEDKFLAQDQEDPNDYSAIDHFSTSNVSSAEEWNRDIQDQEEWNSDIQDQEDNSNTYNFLLHDKIAALKNRIPMSSQLLHRRQVGRYRGRGKHRQSPSPFQTYLKTILPEDETSTEQEDSVKSKEEDLKGSCAGVSDKKQTDLNSTDFIEQKTEESCTSSVSTKTDVESKCKWPTARQPPGFLTRIPSLPIMGSGPISSSVALFGKDMINSQKTLELCEKLNETEQETEKRMKISGLSASFHRDEMDVTSDDVKKDVGEIDDVSGGENWEDSILEVENMETLSLKNQLPNIAMVPDDTVIVSKFPEESGPEQCVPEDQEAITSSMESLVIQHPSNSLCNSQSTLSGIPTISEYETSVKDGDLDSQYEDSLEDGLQRNSSQSVAGQSESDDSSSMYNRSSKQDAIMEGSKTLSQRNRKTVNKGVVNYRNGLNCECPGECVQFWIWRNCICQAPFLCSIQTEANGHPSRNCDLNSSYVYPVEQNNNLPASVGNFKANIDESVLKKWRLTGFWSDAPVHRPADEGKRPRSAAVKSRKQENRKRSSRKVPDRQESLNIGGRKHTQYSRARQLGTASSVGKSDRKSESCPDIVQEDSSNGVGSEVVADGDSGDEYVEEKVDRLTCEEVDDLSESDVVGEQENHLHGYYRESFPPGQSQNYLAYPPNYGYCSPYPPGYSGAPVAVRPGYPASYPELYYPFPHPYMSGGYSRQPYMDGQMYPEPSGFPPPMSYPYHMMYNGWREMSLHCEEPYRGTTPRYRYPSSCANEGQERSRRESESYESYRGDRGHNDVAEDESRHHFGLDGPHLTRKKTEDKIGRSCDKTGSTAAEESPKKNVYIPPHKRIPCMHGYHIDRESRRTTSGPPSSTSYQCTNSEQSRSRREDRNRLDCSSNLGRSELEHERSQENMMWPMPWEYYSSVQNMRGNHSSFYHGWHQQGGLGSTSHTETTESIKASEEEELPVCDISLPPSSTDSTPTSRPPKFSRQKQESDANFVTLDWKSAFLERCNSYGVGYVDSHCHIDFLFNRLDFKGRWSDFKTQYMDTFPPSYLGCVAVFCNPNSFKQEGLWKSLSKEDSVWLTFGCHPKNARDFSRWSEEGLRRCLKNDRVVALGEIGLDYSGGFAETKEMQKSVFKRQIRIALDMKKPLVIHCRDAEKDCLDILKQMVPRDYKVHCHCFTGDFRSAKLWLDHFPNLYIGLTPLVTYRTATGARDVAKFISLGRLLLESDAPYFVPKTIPKEGMNYSHPGLCVTVAEEVARLKNISVQAVLEHCLENTKDMYGI